jgi:hypothetical protein
MNSAYFETRFRVPKPPNHWPEAFAIVTAWETTGEDWPEEKNEVADEALHVDLSDRAVWHQRVIGFSAKTGHAEPGWACELSFDEAWYPWGRFANGSPMRRKRSGLTGSRSGSLVNPAGSTCENLSNVTWKSRTW